MLNFDVLFTIVLAYSLGCLVFGYYWYHFKTGSDIRDFGSGNVGARNVARLLGRPAAALTLFVDIAKGSVAVFLAQAQGLTPTVIGIVCLAVIAGHLWPIQLKFKGGKGFATMLGVLLVYDYRTLAILFAVIAVLFVVTRRATLSGLAATVLLPVISYFAGIPEHSVVTLAVIALLITVTHRNNFKKEILKVRLHEE